MAAESKRCVKCGRRQPLDNFHRHSQMKDGRHPRCKTCRAADANRWYRQNIDWKALQNMRWYHANREWHRLRIRDNRAFLKECSGGTSPRR